MTWKVEIYSELPDEAKAIRQAVFVEEQGFQEEFDELDNTEAAHLVGFVEGEPVCTCRFFRAKDEASTFIIGRVAVMKDRRGQQLGAKFYWRRKILSASWVALKLNWRLKCRPKAFMKISATRRRVKYSTKRVALMCG